VEEAVVYKNLQHPALGWELQGAVMAVWIEQMVQMQVLIVVLVVVAQVLSLERVVRVVRVWLSSHFRINLYQRINIFIRR
jgi:hypothetical protein